MPFELYEYGERRGMNEKDIFDFGGGGRALFHGNL